MVWTAPELIRENNTLGNKAGDVFSFAIVCAEIINMKPIWEQGDTKGNVEGKILASKIMIIIICFPCTEIVYMLRKGGRTPFRPKLEPSSQDLSPALLHLVKDCWSENASDR